MRAPNHPMVAVRPPSGGKGVVLAVSTESALMSPTEALRLHSDLETLLVQQGYLAPRELPHVL